MEASVVGFPRGWIDMSRDSRRYIKSLYGIPAELLLYLMFLVHHYKCSN